MTGPARTPQAARDAGEPTGDVLVLRALGLGDALTGVGALRGLRRAFPGRRVVLAGPPGIADWLRDQGIVDDVLPTEGVRALPDRLAWDGAGHVAVNLHGRGPQSHRLLLATRPARLVAFACPAAGFTKGLAWREEEHEAERWCRLAHWAGGDCGPRDLLLRRPRPPRHRGAGGVGGPGPAAAPTVGGEAVVVVHPGAASGARRWPVERFAAVVRALAAEGRDVVVTGAAAERALVAEVVRGAVGDGAPAERVHDAAARLDLPGLADVVGRAALLVCGDTGVAHLATALRTPSVLLFGPTDPARWGPAVDLDRHAVLWHGVPGRAGGPHAEEVDPALAAITVDEVLGAAERLLSR